MLSDKETNGTITSEVTVPQCHLVEGNTNSSVPFVSFQGLVKRSEGLLLSLLYPGEEEVAANKTPGTTFSVPLPVSLSLSLSLFLSMCFYLLHVVHPWTATRHMDLQYSRPSKKDRLAMWSSHHVPL